MFKILNKEREKSILKTCRINILLNEYLFECGKQKAFDNGLSFSSYIKTLISRDLKKKN
ncbi:MAG: hypothetical protein PHD81_03410 [Candidatus Nanoarchaeia archaeon]|nr:hypothetical protein [Candidatus Nanoarchaeia archaeon]MDD5588132.1 hypothetical protein [Candidatus Nanoarchaeia archaeon]